MKKLIIILILLLIPMNLKSFYHDFDDRFTNLDNWTITEGAWVISNGMAVATVGGAVMNSGAVYKPSDTGHTWEMRVKAGENNGQYNFVNYIRSNTSIQNYVTYFPDNVGGHTGLDLFGDDHQYYDYDNTQWAVWRITWDGTTCNAYFNNHPVIVASVNEQGVAVDTGFNLLGNYADTATVDPIIDYMWAIDDVIIPPQKPDYVHFMIGGN